MSCAWTKNLEKIHEDVCVLEISAFSGSCSCETLTCILCVWEGGRRGRGLGLGRGKLRHRGAATAKLSSCLYWGFRSERGFVFDDPRHRCYNYVAVRCTYLSRQYVCEGVLRSPCSLDPSTRHPQMTAFPRPRHPWASPSTGHLWGGGSWQGRDDARRDFVILKNMHAYDYIW